MEKYEKYSWQCNWLHHSISVFYASDFVLAQKIHKIKRTKRTKS